MNRKETTKTFLMIYGLYEIFHFVRVNIMHGVPCGVPPLISSPPLDRKKKLGQRNGGKGKQHHHVAPPGVILICIYTLQTDTRCRR